MAMEELIGLAIGALVTVCIFSYIFGDNFLYRWAVALLVGVGAGYALAVAVRYLLFDWILPALGTGNIGIWVYSAIPLVLGIGLLFKLNPKIAHLANPSMGFLLGVGTAVAVSGILLGTLVPQLGLTWAPFSQWDWNFLNLSIVLEGVFILIITFVSFWAFYNDSLAGHGRLRDIFSVIRKIGRVFVTLALATAFAGAITTALTLLVERAWAIGLAVNAALMLVLGQGGG